MSRSRELSKTSGFSLIELLMTLALLTILVAVSIGPIGDSFEDQRFQSTRQKLDQIKVALVGDPRLKEGGVRTSFGYFGDLGDFPSNGDGLGALLSKPASASAYAVDSTHQLGLGWRGPYFDAANPSSSTWKDGWGQALQYAYDGTTLTVTSLGADLAVGGTSYNQDLTLTLVKTEYLATVYGFVSNAGSPLSEAFVVQLAAADGSGALAVTALNYDATAAGAFSANTIPWGRRALTISVPTLSKTLGPFAVTIDKKEFEVPPSLLELSP